MAAAAPLAGLATNELISLSQIILSGTFRLAVAVSREIRDKGKVTVLNGDKILSDAKENSRIIISFHRHSPQKDSYFLNIVCDPTATFVEECNAFFAKENEKVDKQNKEIDAHNKDIDCKIVALEKVIETILKRDGLTPGDGSAISTLYQEIHNLEAKKKEFQKKRTPPNGQGKIFCKNILFRL